MSVMASVADFSSVNIGTKALEEEESEVMELTMIVFDSEGNIVARPVNRSGGNSVFMIDTQNATIMDENGLSIDMNKEGHDASVATEYQAKLNACTIYMVANCWEVLKKETINNVSDLLTVDIPVEKIGIPDHGIPMIGFKGGFDLSIDRTSTASTVADIVMDKLYAKVNVRFQINADQVINTPSFTLSGWTVSNIPANVRLGEPAAGAETANATGDVLATTKSSTTLSYGVQTITHSESAANPDYFQFTFYVPEHKVNPTINVTDTVGVPRSEWQRYKPKFCSNTQKPMFVTVKGAYTDHHGQVRDVTYSLYLGQNNTDNFHINRNQELNNIITIKGLTNSVGGADWNPDTPENNISVDHRVDVADNGFSISMEREALLDSHFEVRPMDVFVSNGGKVVLTVNGDWLRIEKSYGGVAANNSATNATYIQNVGVRKYFTTNLVTDELSSDPITINAGENSRIWLYFDENADVYDKTIEDSPMYRDITLTVDYYADANSDAVTKSHTFSFRQMNLWRVRNADNTRYYDIEYHEEYLYNYVSNDNYGKTTDGMAWGLNGVQFSGNMGDDLMTTALVASSSGGWAQDIVNNIISNIAPYYDFYLPREAAEISSSLINEDNLYAGRRFTNAIIDADVDGTTGAYSAISLIKRELNDDPESAIEYCLNKNRRNVSGTVSSRDWYLPSIDEIEEIMVAGYTDFAVFQNKEYWSCQTAFKKNYFLYNTNWFASWIGGSESDVWGDYYIENTEAARATSALYIGKNEDGVDVYTYLGSGVDESLQNLSDSYDQYLVAAYNNQNAQAQAVPNDGIVLEYWTGDRGFLNTPITKNKSIYKVKYASGYNSRSNSINRIRCVRNSGEVSELNATN